MSSLIKPAILWLALAFISNTAHAQVSRLQNTVCGVNPERTSFRNVKREEVALFFVNHAPPKKIELTEFLTTFKSKSARAAALKDTLDTNFLLFRSLDQVVTSIGDGFIQKKMSWIGVEREGDEVTPEREADILKAATAIEAQLKKDRVKAGDIKSFLVLHMGPAYYARWKNEGLRKASRLVSLDDMTIRMRVNAYTDHMETRASELLRSIAHSGIRTSDMEKIVEISQVDLFSGTKDRSPELKELMAKIKKPEVVKLVESYRKWIEQGIDSFAERDAYVSKQILAQAGPGLVHVARGLGPGVSDHLMESCPGAKKSGQKAGK